MAKTSAERMAAERLKYARERLLYLRNVRTMIDQQTSYYTQQVRELTGEETQDEPGSGV